MPKPKKVNKSPKHRVLAGNSLVLTDLEGNTKVHIDATWIPNGVSMSLHGPERSSIQISATDDGVGASLINANGKTGAGILVGPAEKGAGFSLFDNEGRPRVSINGENDRWIIEYTHYGSGKKTITRFPLEILAQLLQKATANV